MYLLYFETINNHILLFSEVFNADVHKGIFYVILYNATHWNSFYY